MINFLDVNIIFFTILGYKMSYIEFFGTIFSLLSIFLMTHQSIFTWPTGLIGVVLFAIIFYKIQLYADFMEQVYYIFACSYGWWFWLAENNCKKNQNSTRFSPIPELFAWGAVTIIASVIFCLFLTRIHILMPFFFPQPATYVWADGITTIMGFVAMFLQARKRNENWIYWIVVNIVSVWLYYVKDIKFISGLYFVYLALAIVGLYQWLRAQKKFKPLG